MKLCPGSVKGSNGWYNAQCAVCKVRCHCIFYGPGIRYSDIFGAPGIRYSVIIKLPCALLQTGHLETVHAPVADTVAYFAGLDAPVVDTVTYFGGNHGSRVCKSLKLKKVFFPRTRTSWDKFMFERIVFLKIEDKFKVVRLRGKIYFTNYTLCTGTLIFAIIFLHWLS